MTGLEDESRLKTTRLPNDSPSLLQQAFDFEADD